MSENRIKKWRNGSDVIARRNKGESDIQKWVIELYIPKRRLTLQREFVILNKDQIAIVLRHMLAALEILGVVVRAYLDS